MDRFDRRSFLRRGAAATAGGLLSATALDRLHARSALAAEGALGPAAAAVGYGPPVRLPDQLGREVLALPAAFSYVTFGETGSMMADGNTTPLALDGMAAFDGPGDTVRLVRNHEDRNVPGAGTVGGDVAAKYDAAGGGGTSTLDYDPASRRLVRDWISLNGSAINCAGGIGYRRRSWITCEETVGGPSHADAAIRFPERHGYCFEVPLDRGPGALEKARPLTAMGRFSHEAVAVDQETGIVYLTEDPGSGRGAGFYRFLPEDPRDLAKGGRLQMLGVSGRPQYDTREGQAAGRRLAVTWLDIADPDPDYVNEDDPRGVFLQGFRAGGAKFNRLEGCWPDEGSVFFSATSGGDAKNGDVNADGYREGYGQVWEYRASRRGGGILTLLFESPGREVLDSPDNLTVTPRGGLMICEDDAGLADADADPLAPGIAQLNRVIGLTPEGEAFPFAVNVLSESEFAGACFSPDGSTFFVNILGETATVPQPKAGMTCAITGPWDQGPL
jgi:secreted PhoX family phosphatase